MSKQQLREDRRASAGQPIRSTAGELSFFADACVPPAFYRVILDPASDYLRHDVPEMLPDLPARLADGLDPSGDEE